MNLGLESKKDIKKGFYVVTWNKLNPFPSRTGITIYSYETSRKKEIESEISTNSYGVKKRVNWSNFISIEFEYQNRRYSHDSMGQVHLLFLLISNFSNGFDWQNGK